jgi:hypothetical protein
MAAGYVHVEIETVQSSKKDDAPCGDVVRCDRTPAATTIVCADGIGSGIRARIAAEMCAGRLLELMRLGFSLRQAFASVVRTMQQNRDPSRPFAAFTVLRVLNDGMATVLSYEAPPAILISRRHASTLVTRAVALEGALAVESDCYLEPGDALLVTSDGITQAGLGHGLPNGWQTEGVVRYVNHCLTNGGNPRKIPEQVHREARRLWTVAGDDCTAVMAICRQGQIVNILTGPAGHRSQDTALVRRFMQLEGMKIVCGGTTAEIVARVLGQHMSVEQNPQSLVAPPRYEIAGVHLVTEGAVTLNQVYNLLEEDLRNLTEDSGVTELCALLQIADRVNILVGTARNRAAGDISFRQRGILTRETIVPLIADKLRAAGKLVVLETAGAGRSSLGSNGATG